MATGLFYRFTQEIEEKNKKLEEIHKKMKGLEIALSSANAKIAQLEAGQCREIIAESARIDRANECELGK